MLLTGCESGSEKGKSEQASDNSQKLTVEFWGTNLSVTNGFKTVANDVVKGGSVMANSMSARLYDKNGEEIAGSGYLSNNKIGQGTVILASYWSEPEMLGDNVSEGHKSGVYSSYESTTYSFWGTIEGSDNPIHGAIKGLVINGKKEKEIIEQFSNPDGTESFFDVSDMASSGRKTYAELYIDGKMIKHDDTIYKSDLDISAANELLTKYRNLMLTRIILVPPGIVTLGREVSEEAWSLYGTNKAFLGSFFIIDKVTEAVENNKKSICTIFYEVRNGRIDTIQINMLVRKDQ